MREPVQPQLDQPRPALRQRLVLGDHHLVTGAAQADANHDAKSMLNPHPKNCESAKGRHKRPALALAVSPRRPSSTPARATCYHGKPARRKKGNLGIFEGSDPWRKFAPSRRSIPAVSRGSASAIPYVLLRGGIRLQATSGISTTARSNWSRGGRLLRLIHCWPRWPSSFGAISAGATAVR